MLTRVEHTLVDQSMNIYGNIILAAAWTTGTMILSIMVQ
jgi:hypothetical protein